MFIYTQYMLIIILYGFMHTRVKTTKNSWTYTNTHTLNGPVRENTNPYAFGFNTIKTLLTADPTPICEQPIVGDQHGRR